MTTATVRQMESTQLAGTDATVDLDFEQLYREHAAFLGRVIVRLVGDGPHADDILQETFVAAMTGADQFGGRSSPRTWLYGIASNLCKKHWRRKMRDGRLRALLRPAALLFGKAPTPERRIDLNQAIGVARSALDELPIAQREAFVLFELEGLNGEEIAILTHTPLATVWSRLSRGRARFLRNVERWRLREGLE